MAADGHWTFKRTGFFNPRITVRLNGHDTDLALFKPQWTGGGVLEFYSGPRLLWGSSGFWRTHWSFTPPAATRWWSLSRATRS